jgi:hypothetical protein
LVVFTFRSGFYILGFGIFFITFSLILDVLGIGKSGIQAAQLLGVLVGVLTSFIGLGVILTRRKEREGVDPWKINWKNLVPIDDFSALVWVLFGFLVTFFLLFIIPSFFNLDHRVHYFNRFLPEIVPIGRDFTYSTNNIRNWLVSGQSPYDAEYHVYPPLYAVVFAPLVLLSYPANFYFITTVTFGCMVILLLLMPAIMKMGNRYSLAVFFFLTAIVSYGMQFEFERGQYNIIAFTLGFLAIYLFHYHESFRHLAYLLFSVSIHLKIYPAILIFMFIKDWRDWRGNATRLIGLGLFNIALLFVLGQSMFVDFLRAITEYTGATWSRPYNLSIRSFVYALSHQEIVPLSSSTASWLNENLTLVELSFMAFFLLCFIAVIVKAYRNNERLINYDLLLICTIGAMIIPSVSIDYKLPLLAPPLVLALAGRSMRSTGLRKVIVIFLVIAISVAYSVTLFPFIDRPPFLANSLPMLFIILAAITLLNFLDGSALAELLPSGNP